MLSPTVDYLHTIYISCQNNVCTDTRNILPGSLFFCLKGPSFNGNHFAADALAKGAAYVVADEKEYANSERIILVDDALAMLQDLAHFHRKSIQTKILAIGGSNGKTTTKELCLAVLGSAYKTKATMANLNNHIGVPLTLLGLKGDEDFAIIELGTNHPGEMKVLCDITDADIGIVTNIGKEHLEGFGSMDAIVREESELYVNLIQNKAMALVNADDPWLGNMAKRLQNSFTYGIKNPANLTATVLNSMPNLTFNLHYQNQVYGPYKAALGGEYNLYNILAAVATGLQSGISLENAAQAACVYEPKNNRSEWRQIGQTKIWMDAYNANPSSMEVALQAFANMPGSKMVLLGDMLELGNYAAEEHLAIFNLALSLGFDQVCFAGPEFKKVAGNYAAAYESTDAMIAQLKTRLPEQNLWLIKGSRGMKMEKVLELFSGD